MHGLHTCAAVDWCFRLLLICLEYENEMMHCMYCLKAMVETQPLGACLQACMNWCWSNEQTLYHMHARTHTHTHTHTHTLYSRENTLMHVCTHNLTNLEHMSDDRYKRDYLSKVVIWPWVWAPHFKPKAPEIGHYVYGGHSWHQLHQCSIPPRLKSGGSNITVSRLK